MEDENKTKAGTFHFVKNDDGTYSARINFDQGYVNNAGTTITGHLWFEGELKKTTVTDEGKIEFLVKIRLDLKFHGKK